MFKLALLVLTLIGYAAGYCLGRIGEHRDCLTDVDALKRIEQRVYALEVRLNNVERR